MSGAGDGSPAWRGAGEASPAWGLGLALLWGVGWAGAATAQPAAGGPVPTATPDAAVSSPAKVTAPPAAEPQRVEIRAGELSDTERRRQDPVARTVYGREELDRYGDSSVSDVLKRLPGVTLQGGNPRLRGLGAGYTLILVNGERAPPGFSLENLSPSQVERIEVTRGPTAEHSAQAVAGTINVVLREVPSQRLRELRATLRHVAEAPTPGLNASWGDRAGPVAFTLPLSAWQWRGVTDVDQTRVQRDDEGQPQSLRVVTVNRWRGGAVNFGPRAKWTVLDGWTLEATAFAQRNEWHSRNRTATEVVAGAAPPAVLESLWNRGHWQVARTGVQSVWRGEGGRRLEAHLGGEVSDSRYRTDITGVDAQDVTTVVRVGEGTSREHVRSTRGKASSPWGDGHLLAAGWELESRARREARRVVDNGVLQLPGFDDQPFAAEVVRQALYLQDEWNLTERLGVYLGLRGERLETASDGGGEALRHGSQVVTPLLHLNFKLDPAGRRLLRASLTRSYRAPDLRSLMARPGLNPNYPAEGPNTRIAPDGIGNPALRPELSTGLDLAWERYLPGGGVLSVGGFHRRIEGLIRPQVALQAVAWSPVPRWVSQPVNLGRARSSGVEVELKFNGQALASVGLPVNLSRPEALNLRASLAAYRSQVDAVPGPDNRLEGQPPASATLGLDHGAPGLPLAWGASLAFTPAYGVRQATDQRQDKGRARTIDAYVTWHFSPEVALRLSGANVRPLADRDLTSAVDEFGYEQSSLTARRARTTWAAQLTWKF